MFFLFSIQSVRFIFYSFLSEVSSQSLSKKIKTFRLVSHKILFYAKNWYILASGVWYANALEIINSNVNEK